MPKIKILHTIWIILLINMFGCEKLELKIDVPACMENEIREYSKSHLACDSGAKIYRYDFQGSQVFVFEPGNCGADMPVNVYGSNCNLICTLGGFAGNAICNSENFYENATSKILVWEN